MKVCPLCRRPFTRSGDTQRTRDHIMPVAWGGSTSFYGVGIVDKVYRPLCARCNSLRGQIGMGHCIGTLACVLAVAGETCEKPGVVAKRWRLAQLPPPIGGKRMRAWIRRAGLAPPLRPIGR